MKGVGGLRKRGAEATERPEVECEVRSRSLEVVVADVGSSITNAGFGAGNRRRPQLLEETLEENPEQPSYVGSKQRRGADVQKGGVLEVPSWGMRVTAELQREAAIPGEARKGREVRGCGRGPGVKGTGRGVP